MKSKRKMIIKDLLIGTKDYITYSELSKVVGVSERTISTYIDEIEKELFPTDFRLLKKRGVGIKLISYSEEMKSQNKNINNKYGVFTRRLEIMRQLLFQDGYLSINKLSENYYVSKSSIDHDLKIIKSILSYGSDIYIVSNNYGTKLEGSELDFQTSLLQFNRYILNEVIGYIDPYDPLEKIDLLENYYGTKIVKTCKNILFNYVKDNSNIIADHYIENILNIYIILVYRLSKNKHHELHFNDTYLKELEYNNGARILLEKASIQLGFDYNESDVIFLERKLVLNRFENIDQTVESRDMVNKIIKNVSDAFSINFFENEEFLTQISKHIPAMIYRLKNHHKVYNPFITQIKTEFSLTFNTIWIALYDYSKQQNFQLTEDEVGFLTLYFQSALEKVKINKKVLLISQLSYPSSEILLNRIKMNFPSIDSVEIVSPKETKTLNLEKYDFIISTINLEDINKEVILISPFLTNQDIRKIRELRIFDTNNINASLKTKIENDYFINEHVFLDENFSTKNDLIENIGKILVENEIVKEDFIKDIIEREKLGGTDLPIGVAIPHGRPKNVIKSSVFFVRTSKKIKWKEYYVDIFFIVCLSDKDVHNSRSVLSHIYQIVNDENKLNILRNERENEIINMIKTSYQMSRENKK